MRMALCRCCVCVHGNGNGKSNTIIQRISGWLAEVKVELQSTMTTNCISEVNILTPANQPETLWVLETDVDDITIYCSFPDVVKHTCIYL